MLTSTTYERAPQVVCSRIDADWPKRCRPIIAVVFLLYIGAAWLTPGVLHPDEHWQTLEFAHSKLGGVAAETLPWEYEARLRPWFQPGLTVLLARVAGVFGVESPFTLALIFRLFFALVGASSTAALLLVIPRWFDDEKEKSIALIAMALACYMPVMHARNSSESLSGSLVCFALALVASGRKETRALVLLGGLCGLAFLARFQVGIMVGGLLAWCLFTRHLDKRQLGVVVAAIGACVVFGVGLDRWGYGEWTFTPWNYLRVNLLEGKASEFGVRPPWFYFDLLWHDIGRPFGGLAYVALLVALVRQPKHLLVWTAVPFVLVHSLIGHKETRFLFPYLFIAPLVAMVAFQGWIARWHRGRRVVLGVLLGLNLWWLAVGHWGSQMIGGDVLRELAERSSGDDTLLYTDLNPYGGAGIYMYFYSPRADRAEPARPHEALKRIRAKRPGETIFYYMSRAYKRGLPPEHEALMQLCDRVHVEPVVARLLPERWLAQRWVRSFFNVYDQRHLFECRGR